MTLIAWTDERIGTLTKLWSEGVSAAKIAAQLGTVQNAIIGKARRLGLGEHSQSTQNRRLHAKHKPRQTTPQKSGPVLAQLRAALPVQPMLPTTPDGSDISTAQRRTLLQLTNSVCKWPFGEPQSPDFFFCGGEAVKGKPYCAGHCQVAYKSGAA